MSQSELHYAPVSRGQGEIVHATRADSLADVLERVLDKGMVIAGDITIRLMDIELLTIHLRLLVASVDKAKEMGLDWWEHSPFLHPPALDRENQVTLAAKEEEIAVLTRRITQLEQLITQDVSQLQADPKPGKKRTGRPRTMTTPPQP